MKIRMIIAASVTALAAVGMAGASAATSSEVPNRECAATGTTELSTGIGLPTAPKTNVGFKITVSCLNGGSLSASGTLTTASCGRSSGSGSLSTGETFNVDTFGGTFVLRGQVTGGGQVVVDATIPNNSCANSTARFFRTTGVVSY